MSLWNTIQNLFVPHDQLRTQAENLIRQYDSDGDGQIDTSQLQAAGMQAQMMGVPAGTFLGADIEGNSNGKMNLKELRNHLKRWDVGTQMSPYGADDKVLDGAEQLQMQMSDQQYVYGNYGGMGYGMQGGFSAYGGVGGYGGFFRAGGGPSAASQAQSGADLAA